MFWNKRQEDRRPVSQPVLVNSDDSTWILTANDISSSGIGLACDIMCSDFNENQRIIVSMREYGQSTRESMLAEIMWKTDGRMGARFVVDA